MQVDVYDTYATSRTGSTMHFDLLVQSSCTAGAAFEFAKLWLTSVGHGDATLKQSRCSFCRSENAKSEVLHDIERDGFHIVRLGGCPPS